MKKAKQILSILLAVVMVALSVPLVSAEGGSCGTNLTWTLDGSGTLTISGTGKMSNYDFDYGTNSSMSHLPPWYTSYRKTIKNIVIEDGVTSIGNFSFSDCERVESVTIGKDVVSIGAHAFDCCSASNINIPNGVTSIGKSAFAHCEINSIVIPASVTTIESDAFFDCTELQNVTISEGVSASIAPNMFEYCIKLNSIVIPNSITSIASQAFYLCSNLQWSVIIKVESTNSPKDDRIKTKER